MKILIVIIINHVFLETSTLQKCNFESLITATLLEMSITNIKEPRRLKLYKTKDEVNFYNFTDGFNSMILFDLLQNYFNQLLLYVVQIVQGNASVKVLTIDNFLS